MDGMEDRQKAFENKFKHDEETKFKVGARRAKLVGLWAAQQLGLNGTEADQYAKAVVQADMESPGDDDVIKKLKADFASKGVVVSDRQIAKQLEEAFAAARQQVMEGK